MAEKRTYTDEQKAEALAIYVDQGVAAASRATGIPSGTIASWAARTEGLQRLHAEKTAEMTARHMEAAALTWAETASELVTGLAAITPALLAVLHDSIESGDMRTGKDAMLTLAVAIDKTQLLSGRATGRIEHSDADGELATEVARLVEERRALAAGAVPLDSRRTA